MVGTRKRRNRWLELIATYKLLQAILLVSVGVGARKLLHKDVAEIVTNIVQALHRNPEGRLVSFLIHQAGLVDDHMLRRISLFLFGYAALGLLEGIGLMLEKVWAEYLTALITASFLPLEIFELVHKITPLRVGFFLANLAVLAYLVSHLMRRRALASRQSVPSQ